jgi:GrpB-like predicted nucleotidyltransferase (UPF0157 family)
MTIVVEPYNPAWPELYETEKALILSALGDRILFIEHIGSTSVPGMSAKAVLDIMATVQNFEGFTEWTAPLLELGYLYRAEEETVLTERRFFSKERRGDMRVFFYLCELNTPFWQDWWMSHIYYRNYLRTNPQEVKRYSQFKELISGVFIHDDPATNSRNYHRTKSPYIQNLMNQAQKHPELGEPYQTMIPNERFS